MSYDKKPTNDLETILKDKEWFHNQTKENMEIVITRYQEDLSWTDGIEHICTIYNKGLTITKKNATVINTPNFGADLETILRHIITRYNSLSPITFFAQGTLADREDQPLYPLPFYFTNLPSSGVKAYITDAYDKSNSRYHNRISSPSCTSINNRNLGQFRSEVVGIPYKFLQEFWVRGDWFSVTAEIIRKKPVEYYIHLYKSCEFQRGIFIEEVWFLERSYYSIFTRPLQRDFVYPKLKMEDVLIK